MLGRFLCGLVLGATLLAASASAGQATIAVAASVKPLAQQLARQLSESTGHRYRLVSGSTGKLYAQIQSGAPFDVFMAADLARPQRLADADRTLGADADVYALGRLALWQPGSDGPPRLDTFHSLDSGKFAIANPRLAPYGAATESMLRSESLWPKLSSRLVQADNIGGAHGLVASGAAAAGIVAWSTLLTAGVDTAEYALLPQSSYPTIEHGVVVMERAADNAAAAAWMSAVTGSAMAALLPEWGFGVPTNKSDVP